jgi:uncharacterized protein with FMN-binding domain
MKKRKMMWVILGAVAAVVVIAIISAVVILGSMTKNFNSGMAALAISNVDLSQARDGLYDGSYELLPISVQVLVTIADHKITAIKLLKHINGQGAGAEVIPDAVVAAQSLEVDTISGATYSSKAILKAIEEALMKAIQ